MTYVDGFVIPVPTKNKAAYIRMAPALSMPPLPVSGVCGSGSSGLAKRSKCA